MWLSGGVSDENGGEEHLVLISLRSRLSSYWQNEPGYGRHFNSKGAQSMKPAHIGVRSQTTAATRIKPLHLQAYREDENLGNYLQSITGIWIRK